MSSSEEVARKLDELWQRFLPAILLRVATIQTAIESLAAGHLDGELKANAAQEAHRLAGSLGTFGLARSSGMSSKIESLLSKSDSIQSMAAELTKLLDSIKREIESR